MVPLPTKLRSLGGIHVGISTPAPLSVWVYMIYSVAFSSAIFVFMGVPIGYRDLKGGLSKGRR